MKKPKFIRGNIYHVYNRGVEKRNIFLNDRDRFRFIHDLFEFNDQDSTANINRREQQITAQLFEVQPRTVGTVKRKLLVEVLAYCLMPNHYHLLLRERVENGIVNFMQKFGTGFAMFFNKKYERVGPLFQGRFKAVLANEDAHLKHLINYIHLNPLDIVAPEWRNKKIANYKKAKSFLEQYRWSSYLDYAGKRNFPSLLQKSSLFRFFEKNHNFTKAPLDFLGELETDSIGDLLLE